MCGTIATKARKKRSASNRTAEGNPILLPNDTLRRPRSSPCHHGLYLPVTTCKMNNEKQRRSNDESTPKSRMLQGNSYFEKATTNTAPRLKKTPRLLHQKESTPKHAAYSEHTLRGEDATTNLLLPQQKTKNIYIPHEKNTYLRTRNRTPTHQSRITPYGGQTLHHDHIRQYDGNAPTRPEAKKNY